jgi:hypothetical protein
MKLTILTLSIMTLTIMTFSKTTLNIMTLSILLILQTTESHFMFYRVQHFLLP